jgi:sigma-B regulation protein RsbU (phosphoserine phosphatase)
MTLSMGSSPSEKTPDHTTLLLRLSKMFNSSLDLEEVLNCVMDEVVVTLHAERGFIMLQEPGGGFQFKVARGIHQEAITDPKSEISLTIAQQVASVGVPVLTSNAQEDDRFSSRNSVIFLGLRSILCVPLSLKGKSIGVVYVDNRLARGVFTPLDLELLSAIASSAAIAIENARLYQVAVEKGRLERELQIARQVQVSLLPKEIPVRPGWEFSALWQPARQVAGDFYDFIQLGPGQLGLLIADVTDKGVPAALFMALAHTILRASLRKPFSAAADLKRANRLICAESTSDYFVTVFYAGLDLKSGQMTYVNAGHPPSFWCRPAENVNITPLVHTGMALGIDPTASFDQQTIQLEPGDYVLGYTDGVTEAFNQGQEMYGESRLRSEVTQYSTLKPSKILEAILRSVTTWSAGSEYFDDMTLLIANRL